MLFPSYEIVFFIIYRNHPCLIEAILGKEMIKYRVLTWCILLIWRISCIFCKLGEVLLERRRTIMVFYLEPLFHDSTVAWFFKVTDMTKFRSHRWTIHILQIQSNYNEWATRNSHFCVWASLRCWETILLFKMRHNTPLCGLQRYHQHFLCSLRSPLQVDTLGIWGTPISTHNQSEAVIVFDKSKMADECVKELDLFIKKVLSKAEDDFNVKRRKTTTKGDLSI